jgi:hypothetical protein
VEREGEVGNSMAPRPFLHSSKDMQVLPPPWSMTVLDLTVARE